MDPEESRTKMAFGRTDRLRISSGSTPVFPGPADHTDRSPDASSPKARARPKSQGAEAREKDLENGRDWVDMMADSYLSTAVPRSSAPESASMRTLGPASTVQPAEFVPWALPPA
jgi:hypothetical protein